MSSGARVRDAVTLSRIKRLAIPPAWTDVWIAPAASAHIQATGRDARGRKQYRYHQEWHARQDADKYARLARFAAVLPKIRARVRRDLRADDTSRLQVLALLVVLLEKTFIRVGNDEYRRTNGSFGLTTLEDRHATVSKGTVALTFKGKSGKQGHVEINDPRIARLVTQCRELPGKRLFQYVGDDGVQHDVRSAELNAYIADAAGDAFTAKDFRTWGATVVAAGLLDQHERAVTEPPGRKALTRDIVAVADQLGNTPAICRKSYIHPFVMQAYQRPAMWRIWQSTDRGRPAGGLAANESRLVRFLRAVEAQPAARR